jgi:transcriptional regulator with XRE-family HTH domain
VDKRELGKRIRSARKRRYLGQAELAHLAGIATSTLWTIENGRHEPRPATVRKLAECLEMSVDEMLKADPRD